jgi:hypothetical protein
VLSLKWKCKPTGGRARARVSLGSVNLHGGYWSRTGLLMRPRLVSSESVSEVDLER